MLQVFTILNVLRCKSDAILKYFPGVVALQKSIQLRMKCVDSDCPISFEVSRSILRDCQRAEANRWLVTPQKLNRGEVAPNLFLDPTFGITRNNSPCGV
jgi:hypothetical protein